MPSGSTSVADDALQIQSFHSIHELSAESGRLQRVEMQKKGSDVFFSPLMCRFLSIVVSARNPAVLNVC